MTTRGGWVRVSRHAPCPICGRPDWCLFALDRSVTICARIESARRAGEAGWLHRLRDTGPTPRRRVPPPPAPPAAVPDFEMLATGAERALEPGVLERLAQKLGVGVASLRRLRVGWSTAHRAWTFPMSDARGRVIGIRLRLPNGRKLSVRGGREGLFIPQQLDRENLLLVCEGASDTAAALDLGFEAVGRPSCTGGVRLLLDLILLRRPARVAVVADADAPGLRGAEHLAALLTPYVRELRVLAPPAPFKDLREWRRAGATAGDLQLLFDSAPPRRPKVREK